jgi:hypothetical protein
MHMCKERTHLQEGNVMLIKNAVVIRSHPYVELSMTFHQFAFGT